MDSPEPVSTLQPELGTRNLGLVKRGAPRSVDRIVGESLIRLISYSAGSDGDGCSRESFR